MKSHSSSGSTIDLKNYIYILLIDPPLHSPSKTITITSADDFSIRKVCFFEFLFNVEGAIEKVYKF